MDDAEALFFIDNQQTQILELYIFLNQPVRADTDVHSAIYQSFDHFVLLFRGAETAQYFNFYREGFHSHGEGGVMLLGQHGSRH